MSRRFVRLAPRDLCLLLVLLLTLPSLARADEKDQQIEALRQEKKAFQQLLEKQQLLLEKQIAQTERAAQERKALEELLKKQDVRAVELEKQLAVLRGQLTTAQVEARVLRARSEEIMARLEEAQKELARLRQGGGEKPRVPGLNPPAVKLEGTVTKVEEKAGLVVIDLGKDAGLQQGHTLEVYRLEPKPTYLGTLQIVEVTAREAVGRMSKPPAGKIQVGDRVATGIPAK